MEDLPPPRNPVPERLARVVDARVPTFAQVGPPWRSDVFVTAAEDVEELSAEALPERLGIRPAPAFYVAVFRASSLEGRGASPVRRSDEGFVGRGRTRGGARESVVPNQPIPPTATIREVH